MGDAADDLMFRELHEHQLKTNVAYRHFMKGKPKYAWTMRNGNKILVEDMTDSHLQNTINMLKRKAPNSDALQILEVEQARRIRNAKKA